MYDDVFLPAVEIPSFLSLFFVASFFRVLLRLRTTRSARLDRESEAHAFDQAAGKIRKRKTSKEGET